MIHAWCFARFKETGHGVRFKRKLRECGLSSIYHDLGNAPPVRESTKRYILRCEHCGLEAFGAAGRASRRVAPGATNVALIRAFR